MSLIDTLDDLVHSGRIEPQTAMKVIATFDKSITEVLADKVKARMNFKVSSSALFLGGAFTMSLLWLMGRVFVGENRVIWIRTASATRSGRSS